MIEEIGNYTFVDQAEEFVLVEEESWKQDSKGFNCNQRF